MISYKDASGRVLLFMFGYLLGRARDENAAGRQRIATVGSGPGRFQAFFDQEGDHPFYWPGRKNERFLSGRTS